MADSGGLNRSEMAVDDVQPVGPIPANAEPVHSSDQAIRPNERQMVVTGEDEGDAHSDEGDSSNSSSNNTGMDEPKSTVTADALETCPICFEPFTSMGEHRMSSLKCGHLFGVTCITRWITARGRRDSRCPQCNVSARKSDIRQIFAASVKTVDTSERDSALKELEKEREARRRLELEVANARLRYQQALTELGRLQEIIDQHTQSGSKHPIMLGATTSREKDRTVRFVLDRTINICKEGSCRVMVSLDYCAMVVVSQPSLTPLFPGFGLKKLNSLEYRACEFIAVHSKPIRDIARNANRMDGLLLTASLDKTLKLTSMLSNTSIETFDAGCGVWSCAWNLDNPYQFFAGLANGSVLLFDTRKPVERVTELRCSDSRSPVIALQYVGGNSCTRFSCGGLLTCQLDGCYFCEARLTNDYHIHPFSTEKGPWTSMSYEPDSCHMMMSCRPNKRHHTIRHLVCEMSQTPLDQDGKRVCHSNIIQTFYGGTSHKTLSRSLLLRCQVDPDITVACASDESSSSVIMWDVNSGSLVQKLPVTETVIDVCPITVNGGHFLGALTERTLNVYRLQSP